MIISIMRAVHMFEYIEDCYHARKNRLAGMKLKSAGKCPISQLDVAAGDTRILVDPSLTMYA